MKKFLLFTVVIVLFSCKNEPKDYVSFQGKITNTDSEMLTIMGKKFKKDIKINKDGTFKDTLKVTDGFHGFNDGSKQSIIYLRNGYDVVLNFDSNDFPNSIQFEGEGASTNNYLTTKLQFIKNEKLDNYKSVFELNKDAFDSRMIEVSQQLDDLLTNANDIDTEVLKVEKENNIKLIDFYKSNYVKENTNYAAFKKGSPSPKFNYPDTNGKNVSLDDLKGKYVYVDVWATWCGPCKREIPFLKKMDEEYKGTDLVILSMSIDKMEHKDKWLKMVKDENLQGIQIMADKDWNSDFVRAYNIQGIPRFILIDKDGNIYDANAPRPSNPKLKELLNSLDL